jgi:hypothetical protein
MSVGLCKAEIFAHGSRDPWISGSPIQPDGQSSFAQRSIIVIPRLSLSLPISGIVSAAAFHGERKALARGHESRSISRGAYPVSLDSRERARKGKARKRSHVKPGRSGGGGGRRVGGRAVAARDVRGEAGVIHGGRNGISRRRGGMRASRERTARV